MSSEPGKQENPPIPPDMATWDMSIEGYERPVIRLGEEIVIDARDKPIRGSTRRWTDRDELRKYDQVTTNISYVVRSCLFYKVDAPTRKLLVGNAFINEMRNLGFKVNSARIIGQIPKHWRPGEGLADRWVYKPEHWQIIKSKLLDLKPE